MMNILTGRTEQFQQGKWAKYELKKSIENNNVLIYLVNNKDEQIYKHYKKTMMKELKAERTHCITWNKSEDLNFLPEMLTSILNKGNISQLYRKVQERLKGVWGDEKKTSHWN